MRTAFVVSASVLLAGLVANYLGWFRPTDEDPSTSSRPSTGAAKDFGDWLYTPKEPVAPIEPEVKAAANAPIIIPGARLEPAKQYDASCSIEAGHVLFIGEEIPL